MEILKDPLLFVTGSSKGGFFSALSHYNYVSFKNVLSPFAAFASITSFLEYDHLIPIQPTGTPFSKTIPSGLQPGNGHLGLTTMQSNVLNFHIFFHYPVPILMMLAF